MDRELRNNIRLYNDVFSMQSTNFCRLKHIINPANKMYWDSDKKLGTYEFPCQRCERRMENICTASRLDLRVK